MAQDPASQPRPAHNGDASDKRSKDAYYFVSLTIPQSALSSLCVSDRQLGESTMRIPNAPSLFESNICIAYAYNLNSEACRHQIPQS
jgi:hypothetical protein